MWKSLLSSSVSEFQSNPSTIWMAAAAATTTTTIRSFVVVAFVAILGDRLFLRHRRRSNMSEREKGSCAVDDAGGRWIPLLPSEEFHMMSMPSPGLQSKFVCDDVNETLQFLRQRAKDIIQLNPWVLGRLKRRRRRQHGGGGRVALWVPDTDNETEESKTFLQVLHVDDISSTAALPQVCHVKSGKDCLEQDELLLKVTVLVPTSSATMTSKNTIAVVLSLCHLIGDASTIYELWGMFGSNAKPYAMTVERVMDYKGGSLITSLGKEAYRKIWWWILWCEWGPLQKFLGRGPKLETLSFVPTCRYVNEDWIKAQKQLHTMNHSSCAAEYVSSCDLLTSWFFTQTNPAAGTMAFNLRHRRDGLTTRHVGNYVDMLVLFPEEFKSPECIRKCVLTQGEFGIQHSRPGPDGRTCAVMTAWHTFHQEMDLPNCQCITHLPLARGAVPMLPLMVVFRTVSQKLAVYCCTHKPLETTPVLGDIVAGWQPIV